MDTAKAAVTNPYVAAYLKWEYWPYYLAAVCVIVLLLVVAILLLRGRISHKLGIGKRLPGGLLDRQEKMPQSSLKKVWKRFLSRIPHQLRRAAHTAGYYVVFGELGSGKSLVIDNHTDWRGQANRFYPSYTVDPLLQIYLGSKELVMEIPSPLLNNTSRHVRNALLKLWKPLFESRDVTVVVVLSASALMQELPENIRRSAQMARGKINILSSIRKRPVNVHLVISHMDQVEGYAAFAEFMAAEGFPLNIQVQSKAGVEGIAAGLTPFEPLLPKILTSRSADDYLRVLSFFRAAQGIFKIVSTYAKTLQGHDPMSPAPSIARVCLTSRRVEEDAPGANPFVRDLPSEPQKRAIPNLRHRLAAAIILAIGLSYLGADYYFERAAMKKVDEVLNLINNTPLQQYGEYSRGRLDRVMADLRENIWLYLPPTFHSQAESHLKEHFVATIRKHYLIPSFNGLATKEDAQEGGIYLLGLLYATSQNQLGKLVLANAEEWRRTLNLPVSLVNDYVRNNERAEGMIVDWSTLPSSKRTATTASSDNLLPWVLFFKKVKTVCDEPSISKEYLHQIQKEADAFRREADRISRYKLTNELVTLLVRETPVAKQIQLIQKRDATLEQESLRDFLYKIKEEDIDYPSIAETGLAQFLEGLKATAEVARHAEDKEYRFTFMGENFVFTSSSWSNLILRSRLTLAIREFQARNKSSNGMLFFSKISSIGYPDIVMNPSNDGLLFFLGKGKVDGKFSKSAFEQQVKPVLSQLPEIMKELPIADVEKNRFTQFILKESEAYADRYVSAYRSFYSQFRLAADSLGGLRYLLKQMQLPSSPFQEFFVSIKENTALDVGDSPYMRQFSKKLGPFEFIRRLMAEKDGVFPEFAKYIALVQQLDNELEGSEPFTIKNKADDANEFKRILSPAGRMSLAIQRGENDSYLSLVRMWLKSTGIDTEWQNPFLDPISVTYNIGRSDVETSVEKVWSDLFAYYVKPLYNKFPFQRQAEVEISPPELEKTLHPQGAFWKTFRDYLAPVCVENSGFWTVRESAMGVFRIPPDMLGAVNELSALSSALWNDKGVPQPIVFQILPSKLPPRTEHAPLAILSYLRSDKSSVFAFNQQPSWQRIEIEWWKPQTSAVGVEFEAFQDAGKSYRELTIPERYWSFHQLLNRAEVIDKNFFVWHVSGPAPKSQGVRAAFTIKSDPWAVFHLNGDRQGS